MTDRYLVEFTHPVQRTILHETGSFTERRLSEWETAPDRVPQSMAEVAALMDEHWHPATDGELFNEPAKDPRGMMLQVTHVGTGRDCLDEALATFGEFWLDNHGEWPWWIDGSLNRWKRDMAAEA